jgi:hypothetical protein
MPPFSITIPPTTIASVSALRSALDYGDSSLARCSAFYDDLNAFRKKYTTASKLSGIDLHDWKNPVHLDGLLEMTFAYLDREGNGSLFWPDNKTLPNYNRLQYAKNHLM